MIYSLVMRTLPFLKMNGAGNDFVVLDDRQGQLTLDGPARARLCDPPSRGRRGPVS